MKDPRDVFQLLMESHATHRLAERGNAIAAMVMKRPCTCGHVFDEHAIEWEDVPTLEFPHAKRAHGKTCGAKGCGCLKFEKREG